MILDAHLERFDAVLAAMTQELDRPSRLAAVGDLIVKVSHSQVIQALVNRCAVQMQAHNVVMSLVDDMTCHVAAAAQTLSAVPRDQSYCQYVIASGDVVSIPNAKIPSLRDVITQHDAVSAYLGVPVRTGAGEAIGALYAIDPNPRDWGKDDVALLKIFSLRVTTALVEDRL